MIYEKWQCKECLMWFDGAFKWAAVLATFDGYKHICPQCFYINHENAKQQNKLQPTDLETGEANHTES